MEQQYEKVIGVEVHVELATKTKIFCGCSTAFGAIPNSQTCPVCTGMPGTLPVLNKQVVAYALAVGLAMECEVTQYSRFDRKNYFYPDNPQNYQISQLYLPICKNGHIEIETEQGERKRIGIHEMHMEEDAGKMIHDEQEAYSFVDYNRAGVPLIEIVSKPDMRSAQEVVEFLEKLRLLIQYLGASDCKLQEGSMRVDVNLSVRKKGAKELGVRTEMKNLNSFKAITRAIENETKRQIALLEEGREVLQETRRWDDAKECSYSMRSKEDAKDYRYFPEPDLPPFYVSDAWIAEIKAKQPELRDEKRERYVREYKLPTYDANVLTGEKALADIFEETVKICKKPKKVSNWIMGETLRLLNENGMDAEELSFSPEHLAELIELVEQGVINGSTAKEVFEVVFAENVAPRAYVEEKGLKVVCDEDTLKNTISQVLENNPKSVEDYRNGKEKAMGYLVGQTMKEMKGKADPGMVNKILKDFLQD